MSTLTSVRAIEDLPELVDGMGSYLASNADKVCAVCGLQVMGHGPESEWLGYERHDYQGRPATADALKASDALSREAYRLRYRPESPR